MVWDTLSPLLPHCHMHFSDGAFYYFIGVPTKLDSITLAKQLITDYGIVSMPGEAFGMSHPTRSYLRISYGAQQPEVAVEGTKRFVKGVKEICRL